MYWMMVNGQSNYITVFLQGENSLFTFEMSQFDNDKVSDLVRKIQFANHFLIINHH
jgi:hypothetical protein